ncbi:phosphoadenosine phosphosulfate reductase family protein [Roseobacter sp. HKCCD9010]|uniref:phosphoadenosine phosphosulfate reductase domain-containing protein n=1 Tax=unclassified Roseobacter TaxID=196798 RepID=UPI00149220E3|nr:MULTISPECIES: phosphoadenosine phosphosulfate reductase family protein [unclassified Roseobacter]MBF9050605.1 phosphoadenosine phosphosulfate reductase family protein [Rhodobacterales bacterium HKCCD4356]NNV11976.1 phosphoadenosine phosphosulfate reductase family protein [Roseobacter sp. HKCCD7357]NNV16989.1 phosphoadenosine phosphosulfate reductase family protein [Roseobacter sp. HKCCD8768]NNV26219.1 phosphoadenosine phosphosulfate reductase family protein [Roseobacter sp. HKCCD8192]NNV307
MTQEPATLEQAIDQSAAYVRLAIEWFDPTHIVTMVSGGNDSAATHALAVELGLPVAMSIHGRTGCGLQATEAHVEANYGHDAPLVIADAGRAYEEYVMRKGFFGKGTDAHKMAYHVLKAGPFRKTVSKELRQGKRNTRVLLLNGAFRAESPNRSKTLKRVSMDPAAPMNMWFNLIHDWTPELRDKYLASRNIPINPVSKALCRSGECMCGTMQTAAQRIEAAAFDPTWGAWLDDLEAEARAAHGFGWGESKPRGTPKQPDLFMPMCSGCSVTVHPTNIDMEG